MRKRRIIGRIYGMNKRTIKRQKQIQEENKKEWASSIGLCQKRKPQHPHHVKVSPWGPALGTADADV